MNKVSQKQKNEIEMNLLTLKCFIKTILPLYSLALEKDNSIQCLPILYKISISPLLNIDGI